ncbi:MAG TPA: hypothetical protein VFE20_04175 [Thermoleophilia bacterium]|nr:hypothetical protein [Thermoleophilia bacterium]
MSTGTDTQVSPAERPSAPTDPLSSSTSFWASKTAERILTLLVVWGAAAAITYVFWWIDNGLVDASLFSAVFAYWGLFFIFTLGLYLGLGGGDCYSCTLENEPFSPEALRKAAGIGIAMVGTAISVALTTHFAQYAGPEGAQGLNLAGTQVFSLLPLHWGFVWVVFVQHVGLV